MQLGFRQHDTLGLKIAEGFPDTDAAGLPLACSGDGDTGNYRCAAACYLLLHVTLCIWLEARMKINGGRLCNSFALCELFW